MSTRAAAALLAAALFVFAAVPVSADEQVYVVQSGDTLSYIALLYGVSVADIAIENGLQIDQLIYVGQTLTIPDGPRRRRGRQAVAVHQSAGQQPINVRIGHDDPHRGGRRYPFENRHSLRHDDRAAGADQ